MSNLIIKKNGAAYLNPEHPGFWLLVPADIDYIAMDSNGIYWCYLKKPIRGANMWCGDFSGTIKLNIWHEGGWKDSLYSRDSNRVEYDEDDLEFAVAV